MKNRIICLAIAFAVLFGFASCNKTVEEEVPPKDHELSVEIETVEYDEASINEASARIADITAEMIKKYYNKQLTDDELASVDAAIKTEIFPSVQEIPIYKNELFAMIECAEKYFEAGEDEEAEPSGSYFDLYKSFGEIIDGARLGALVYELEIFNLDRKADEAMKKYNNGSGNRYLEEAEYYESLIAKAEQLGRVKFADAFSVFAFMVSSAEEGVDIDTGDLRVTFGDIFVILGKQGEKFASMGLSEADWQIVAEICEDFIPTKATNLRERIMISLGYDDFFIHAAAFMKDVVDFYAILTRDISKENIPILEANEPLAYERVVCGELLKNRDALVTFLSAMEEKIPEAGAKSLSAIKSYDKAGYHEFLERDTADIDDVISTLEVFVAVPTEQAFAAVQEMLVAFVAGINPVVAYVYLYH